MINQHSDGPSPCPLPPCLRFSFLIGQTFLTMLCTMTWGVFIMFAGFVILMTFFIIFCIPETKGVPVESVEKLIYQHWLWSKLAATSGADLGAGVEGGTQYVVNGEIEAPAARV